MKLRIKTKKAAGVKVTNGKISSQLYRKIRGSGLNVCNCRKDDFSAQVFETGKIKGVPSVIIIVGQYGTTLSELPVKGNKVQLKSGQVFDLSGIKQVKIVKRTQARTIKGDTHVIAHGPKKTERAGRIIGNLDKQYVGFVSNKGEVFTLETKSISDGRNKANLFSVLK